MINQIYTFLFIIGITLIFFTISHDYLEYRDLQKRLKEEKQRKKEMKK